MYQELYNELSNEPVSTANPAFAQIVDMVLSERQKLVILVRYAYRGGYNEHYLIKNMEEFYAIMQNSRPKTSLSVFFEKMLPIKGEANTHTQLQVIEFLNKQPQDEREVFVIRLNPLHMASEFDIFMFERPKDITDWFEKNVGVSIMAGGLRFWESNSDRVVTAYVPDEDGIVRPGAY